MPPKYNLWFELKKKLSVCITALGANKVTWGYVVPITIFESEIFSYSKYFPLLCVPGSAHAHRNYLGLSVVPIQHYNLLQSVEYFGTIMDC